MKSYTTWRLWLDDEQRKQRFEVISKWYINTWTWILRRHMIIISCLLFWNWDWGLAFNLQYMKRPNWKQEIDLMLEWIEFRPDQYTKRIIYTKAAESENMKIRAPKMEIHSDLFSIYFFFVIDLICIYCSFLSDDFWYLDISTAGMNILIQSIEVTIEAINKGMYVLREFQWNYHFQKKGRKKWKKMEQKEVWQRVRKEVIPISTYIQSYNA